MMNLHDSYVAEQGFELATPVSAVSNTDRAMAPSWSYVEDHKLS